MSDSQLLAPIGLARLKSTRPCTAPCEAVVSERWEYAHSECTRCLARLWLRHGMLLGEAAVSECMSCLRNLTRDAQHQVAIRGRAAYPTSMCFHNQCKATRINPVCYVPSVSAPSQRSPPCEM